MKYRIVSLVFAAAAIAACGTSTKYTNEFVERSYTGGPIDNILVVGVVDQVSQERTLEMGFVDAFTAKGVDSTASYTVIPTDTSATREEMMEAITKAGYGGVVLIKLVGVDQRTKYTPGYSHYGGMGYGGFYGSYYGGYGMVHTPGHYSTYDYVTLEISFYDTQEYKLLWGGTSESFAPSSAESLVKSLAGKVTTTLRSNGLI